MLILESEGGRGRLFERGACLTLGPGVDAYREGRVLTRACTFIRGKTVSLYH